MTFREAWVEALKRSGAAKEFVQAEQKRDGPLDMCVDKEIGLPPDLAEKIIVEMAEILSCPDKAAALANWLERLNRNN